MRRFRLFVFLAVVILSSFFLFPQKVNAEVIKSFDTEIVAHNDGTMDIKESIVYDFEGENRHGIYRDIPLVSRVGDLYRVIKIDFQEILRDGQNEEFINQSSDSQASVKIGRKNVTITGSHVYTISYKVKNGIGSNFSDHDEIYWNVTGNNWKIPILEASSKISIDSGIEPDKATCFTGVKSSTEKNCNDSQILVISAKDLQPYEGLTAVWSFKKNTFLPSILQKTSPVGQNNSIFGWALIFVFFGALIILNLIIAPIIFIWYLKNKRKVKFGPPSVNFDLPKDQKGKRISPAEAGSIDTYQVDQNDAIATIFDLAIRKYLKIEQVKKKKILGVFEGGKEYVFTKLKNFKEGMEPFELMLASTLFSDGDSIELSSLKKDFYITFQCFEKDVFQSLIDRKFYYKNPKTQMTLLFILGIFVIFMGGIILGPVLIFLSKKLNGRTALGDETDWKIDGLKIFLKNMKVNYKWQAENLYIVEHLIPYAIAFGYIKEFMEQLKIIYPNYSPTWYHGNMAFLSISNNMFNSMSSNFTTSAPSSSSGFSGGSSGGGGGGGGGGSW